MFKCSEVHSADLHESIPVQQDLIDSVSPFIVQTSWMTMANPESSDELKAMKFEGGWSTASYRL